MSEPDYDAILEGQCPHGHGPLELKEGDSLRFGWCEACRTGYSTKGTAAESLLSLHFVADTTGIEKAFTRAQDALARLDRRGSTEGDTT